MVSFLVFLVLSMHNLLAFDNFQLAKTISYQETGDFEKLQDLINQKTTPIESPEKFLTLWSKQAPYFFNHYVLGYRSRSLQSSSFSHPRALLYNLNADLVIAFNGHSKHLGYDAIELMKFNHSKDSFEFYELSFKNNSAKLSDPNPVKCLVCHQNSLRADIDPRPNWEPYNKWFGFYGSIDDDTDQRKDGYYLRKKITDNGDHLLLTEIDQETEQFQNFLTHIQPGHLRYSLLNPETVDQYGKYNTLNGDLTNRLGTLNYRRLARLIRNSPKELYEFVKWTVWAHARCGNTLYIPKDNARWLYGQLKTHSDAKERFFKLADEDDSKEHGYLDDYWNSNEADKKSAQKKKSSQPRYYMASISDIVNLLFESFGVDTEDWSMDFQSHGARYAHRGRFGLTNNPWAGWSKAIQVAFADDPDFTDISCKDVYEKSLANFQDLEKVKVIKDYHLSRKDPVLRKPLIQTCVACHVTENYGMTPYISFDQPEKLVIELQRPGYKRGTLMDEIVFRLGSHATIEERMPRGRAPHSSEVKELLNYLKAL